MSELDAVEDNLEVSEDLDLAPEELNETFLTDYFDKVEQVEEQLEDVIATLEAIAKAEGVCQKDLVSFEHILPTDYPLASFTQNPSLTNYDVARIALEDKKFYGIAAIVAAVAAMIAAALAWILGRRQYGKELETRGKELKDKINDNAGSIRDSRRLHERTSKNPIYKTSFDRLKEAETAFLENANDYSIQCLLGRGAFMDAVFHRNRELVKTAEEMMDYITREGNIKDIKDQLDVGLRRGEYGALAGKFSTIIIEKFGFLNKAGIINTRHITKVEHIYKPTPNTRIDTFDSPLPLFRKNMNVAKDILLNNKLSDRDLLRQIKEFSTKQSPLSAYDDYEFHKSSTFKSILKDMQKMVESLKKYEARAKDDKWSDSYYNTMGTLVKDLAAYPVFIAQLCEDALRTQASMMKRLDNLIEAYIVAGKYSQED